MKKVFIIIFLSALFASVPITIIRIHHYFITGLTPFLAIIITPVMLSPAILILYFFIKFFKKHISFTPDLLFTTGLFSYLILIFLLQIFYGNSALDIHVHDTYFVMPYSYPFFFAVIAFSIFAAIYYWFDKIFKRQMNYTLGYIHFWISFLGVSFLLLPMLFVQLAGMPRRYYKYSHSASFDAFNNQSILISTLTILLVGGQLLFIFNFCYSIFRKKK